MNFIYNCSFVKYLWQFKMKRIMKCFIILIICKQDSSNTCLVTALVHSMIFIGSLNHFFAATNLIPTHHEFEKKIKIKRIYSNSLPPPPLSLSLSISPSLILAVRMTMRCVTFLRENAHK